MSGISVSRVARAIALLVIVSGVGGNAAPARGQATFTWNGNGGDNK
jgi:hypothetical protein